MVGEVSALWWGNISVCAVCRRGEGERPVGKVAYAQHILLNQQGYGIMHNLMTLLKPLNNPTMLTPYEQFYIQSLQQEGKLIP